MSKGLPRVKTAWVGKENNKVKTERSGWSLQLTYSVYLKRNFLTIANYFTCIFIVLFYPTTSLLSKYRVHGLAVNNNSHKSVFKGYLYIVFLLGTFKHLDSQDSVLSETFISEIHRIPTDKRANSHQVIPDHHPASAQRAADSPERRKTKLVISWCVLCRELRVSAKRWLHWSRGSTFPPLSPHTRLRGVLLSLSGHGI